jgi:hypothetical protein
MKTIFTITAALLFFSNLHLTGQVPANADRPRFGPWVAIEMDRSAMEDVKYDSENRVWLKFTPAAANKALTIKLSNRYMESYRPFSDGSMEMNLPANRGNAPGQWTDWLRTSAAYMEYWIDGQLILHLKRESSLK